MHIPHKILITGAAGYVGSMLVRELLASGHAVLAVDCLSFGDAGLAAFKGNPHFTFLDADVRDLTLRHFSGVAAVVDLAAISSVSAAEQDARHTDVVNHLGRVRVAQLAQAAGVARHVLVSSAAVYGNTGQEIATEASPLAPQNEYARACVQAEQGVLALASARFCPVVLRPGTAYGLSPRMRTDLMLNRMTISAVQERKITLHGGGLQWRPHVHVRDLVRAIVAALRVATHQVHAEIFNISHSNLRVLSIAAMVREVVGSDVSILSDGGHPDPASYRLDCSKARQQLGWRHYESICSGTYEVAAALRSGVAPFGASNLGVVAQPAFAASGWVGGYVAEVMLS